MNPNIKSIIELFEETAHKNSKNPALYFNESVLSYEDLNKKSNQVARLLRKKGFGVGTIIAVGMSRSPEMLAAILGILKAGGAYLALDCNYPQERLRYILENSKASVVLVSSGTSPLFVGLDCQVIDVKNDIFPDEETFNLNHEISPDDPAYVIYTSGSTGMPKGVVISHGSLNNYLSHATEIYLDVDHDKVGGALFHTSIAFDLTVTSIFTPLLQGGSVFVMPEGLDAEGLAQEINQNRDIKLLKVTPSHLRALNDYLNFQTLQDITLVVGGEELIKTDIEKWVDVKGVRIFNEYGPTEATVGCAVFKIDHTNIQELATIPIGSPIWNTEIYIFDENLNPVEKGREGEICIAGSCLAQGYINQDYLNNDKFIWKHFPNSQINDDGKAITRLYRTGDLGKYLPDGTLVFLGRQDDQIKIRGYRIEIKEIECVLNRHGDIKNSCIVPFRRGQMVSLVAYVIPGLFTPSDLELREFLESFLPDYMIPSFFIFMDHIPLNINGKVDRKQLPLPALFDDNKPVFAEKEKCSKTEEILKEIWSEVLRVKTLSIHDNFYKVGGDSIVSLQMVAKARKKGLYFSVQDVFRNPSISSLSRIADEKSNTSLQENNVKLIRTGISPLLPIQRWFFQHDFLEKNHFTQAILLKTIGKIVPEHLNKALNIIIKHREALGSRFYRTQDGEWRQEYEKFRERILVDVKTFEAENNSVIAEEIYSQSRMAQKDFDIEQGELVKAVIFNSPNMELQYVLLSIHHLVVDTVSWRILIEDLENVYKSLEKSDALGIQEIVPEISTCSEWANNLMEYASSEKFEMEKAYWKTIENSMVDFHADFNLGPLSNEHTNSFAFSLTKKQTSLLLQTVNGAYGTQINDILLTALVLAAGDVRGKYELGFCLEGHGREDHIVSAQIDLSQTVGWFTSLFPVNLHVDNPDDLAGAIKKIKEHLRSIPNKGIGYGLVNYREGKTFFDSAIRPSLIFNYLGQWDFKADENRLFHFADNLISECASKSNAPFFPLEINAEVKQDRFNVLWTYSTKHFKSETIEKFVNAYQDRLCELIHHCCEKTNFGYTPSDFPRLKITQADLDRHFSHKGDIEDIYPLSNMQFGILFHHLHKQDTKNYFVQTMFKLDGNVDKNILNAACQEVCDNNQILRTGFIYQGLVEPVQYVIHSLPIEFTFMDWTSWEEETQKSMLNAFLSKDQERGFNLEEPPLVRAALIQKTRESYYFCWTQHHILLDGTSSSLILNELFERYRIIREGKKINETFPRPPYGNYVEWQNKKQNNSDEAKNFWKEYLSGLEDVTEIGFRELLAEKSDNEYDSNSLLLAENDLNEITQFASENSFTLNTILLGAISLALSNYTLCQEIVLGITVSGRNPEVVDVENMVGLLINTLPLRIKNEPSSSVFEFLQEIQDSVQLINQYSYLPLAYVQSLSKTDRHIFNTIFVFEKHPIDQVIHQKNPDFQIGEFTGIENTEYPLTITALQGERLEIILNYQTSLFNKTLTDRMLKNFLHAIRQIIKNKNEKVSSLDLLCAEEKKQLLEVWSHSSAQKPNEDTLNKLFEECARQNPTHLAVICEEKTISYGELNARSNRLGRYLISKNLTRESFVVIWCNRSIDMVAGILAVLKAGCAYIPIDPAYPPETVRHIVKDSKASFILTNGDFIPKLSGVEAEAISFEDTLISDFSPENINLSIAKNSLAYVIYTSGSTGKPKGVMIEHYSASARLSDYQNVHPLTKEDVVLCQTSIGFDVSVAELFWPFSVGATVVLSSKQSAEHLIDLENLIYTKKITFIQTVPSVLKLILNHIDENKIYNLKGICSGGEVLDYKLVEECRKKLPNTRIFNAYGPTETTIDATIHDCTMPDELAPAHVSIGRPLGHSHIYILNDLKKPVPVGVAGELYIGGDCVARGYLGNRELTDKAFLENPFNTSFSKAENSRLYKTGDLCRWLENGNLEYAGRRDHQIKIRGFRVELEEIEEVLVKNFDIKYAVVSVKHDNSGNKQLIACVVSDYDSYDLQNVRNQLRDLLPSHMIPNNIIALEKISLSPTGKIDRKKIAALIRDQQKKNLIKPRSPLELELCEIWKKILNIKDICIRDNFFSLGGNSILATQLILSLKKTWKQNISFSDFLSEPTIENLAGILLEQNLDRAHESVLSQIQEDLDSARLVTRSGGQTLSYKRKDVLLTGASGFLGSHLLQELLNTSNCIVYCLLRGENIEEATINLRKNLRYYNLENLLDSKRIVLIQGDLSKPGMGLDRETYETLCARVSDIFHNAAFVHHIYDYSTLRPGNVIGTIEILKLAACGTSKKIHFVSTLSASMDKNETGQIMETFVQQFPVGNEGGYSLTKWTSEKILAESMQRGFNVNIYRLPQIMGHSRTGVSPRDKIHIMLLIKNWIELGIAPKSMGRLEFLPVDVVAGYMVKIYAGNDSNKVFNFGHPQPASYDSIIHWLNEFGYKINLVNQREWERKCKLHMNKGSALYPLLSLYISKEQPGDMQKSKTGYREDNAVMCNTTRFIRDNKMDFPEINRELFFKYFEFLKPWLDTRQ